jgi:hypothetical protein
VEATILSDKDRWAAWYAVNKDRQKATAAAWYAANKERRLAATKEWKIANPEKQRAYHSAWKKRNPKKVVASVLARRRNRRPNWADVTAIRNFYLNTPPGHHVDHVIPLHGRRVSGLHTLENLQYLPAKLNLRKSNAWL